MPKSTLLEQLLKEPRLASEIKRLLRTVRTANKAGTLVISVNVSPSGEGFFALKDRISVTEPVAGEVDEQTSLTRRITLGERKVKYEQVVNNE